MPYYARLEGIIKTGSERLHIFYCTRIKSIQADGRMWLERQEELFWLPVDHVVKEIGGEVDYLIFHGFRPLQVRKKNDDYRFQLEQIATRPHNYESLEVANLYPGGYLAAGLGLLVITMHGTTMP